MRLVTVAATQMACDWDRKANIARAESLIRQAAQRGANIILIQELFETPYFCKDQNTDYFQLATTVEENPAIAHFQRLAAELSVVLPVSFFERQNNAFYNSVAIVDADGSLLGVYRKTHIPDGPGYQEKFYFSPGDTGFKVWQTRFGTIGVGICWDQWFPETARAMTLMGAELLFYPTAIGSEPHDPSVDSSAHWQRVMQGHSAANCIPVIASNRVGVEAGESCSLTFYGSSFISDATGAMLHTADRTEETVLCAQFDLEALRAFRIEWGLFRDRRPEHYKPLLTLDGVVKG